MKKGFTMIELIFVIVILGILASVAIPRLAATREDAEISAAVANLRTLVSDATAYHTAKGTFGATNANGKGSNIKWNAITNVPIKNPNGVITNDSFLVIGGQDCINFTLRGATDKPAHFVIAKQNGASGVCKQVQDSEPLKAYFTSTVNGKTTNNNKSYMAIGSSTSIYDEQTTPPSSSS